MSFCAPRLGSSSKRSSHSPSKHSSHSLSKRGSHSPSKQSSHSPSKSTILAPFALVPSEALVPERKPWGSSSSASLVQPPRDVYAPDGIFTQVIAPELPPDHLDVSNNKPLLFTTPATSSTTQSNSRKKERQWDKWANNVIPSLLASYLALLRRSDSLCEDIPKALEHSCGCPSHVQRISVACVYFERLYDCFQTYPFLIYSRNQITPSLLLFSSIAFTITGVVSMLTYRALTCC
jgi:hypothetical protein